MLVFQSLKAVQLNFKILMLQMNICMSGKFEETKIEEPKKKICFTYSVAIDMRRALHHNVVNMFKVFVQLAVLAHTTEAIVVVTLWCECVLRVIRLGAVAPV